MKLIIAALLGLSYSSLYASDQTTESKSVLFLCTGNFYRSRLAEAVFNYEATKSNLPWRSFSRALRRGPLKADQQAQKLSPYTRAKLSELKIPLSFTGDEPVKASAADLNHAKCVVALSRREHQPLLEAGFAPLNRYPISYWDFDDVRDASPNVVMPAIVARVRQLVADLKAGKLPEGCAGR